MGNEPVSGGPGDEPNVFRPDTVISPSQMAPTPNPIPTPDPVVQPTPISSEANARPFQGPAEVTTVTMTDAPAIQQAAPMQPQPAPIPPQPQAVAPPVPMPQPAASQPVPFPTQPVDDYAPQPAAVPNNTQGAISWTASEFIANAKGSSWYGLLVLAAAFIAAVTWLFTRDIFATVAVITGVVLLGIYAGRQPKQETFTLDDHGLSIGNRFYPYNEFRSFAAIPEGAFTSVEFTPLKRLAIDTTIYIDPAKEEDILGLLSQYLPMEEARPNMADNLMRRIHF